MTVKQKFPQEEVFSVQPKEQTKQASSELSCLRALNTTWREKKLMRPIKKYENRMI